DDAVDLAQPVDLVAGLPGDALRVVAEALHQRSERDEASVGVRVVALDDGDLRRRAPGLERAFAALPFAHVERLAQLGGRIVQQRREDDVALDAEMPLAQL